MTTPSRPPRTAASDDREGDVLPPRVAASSGVVFLASGGALVGHIVTGAPLPVLLAVLVVLGGVLAALSLTGSAGHASLWRRRVLAGAVVGLLATGVYDGSRWLLVQTTTLEASPFEALPLFGQALAGGAAGATLLGIAFHLVNGVAFGTAYTIWFGHRGVPTGIGYAMVLEAFMLALYPGWLDPRSLAELTSISLLGHVAYGVALGVLAPWALRVGTGPRDAGSAHAGPADGGPADAGPPT